MKNEQTDVADLESLLTRGRWQFMALARAMLTADVLVAGLGPAAQAHAASLKDVGFRIVLELSAADDVDEARVRLVAVSPQGHRVEISDVSEQLSNAPN